MLKIFLLFAQMIVMSFGAGLNIIDYPSDNVLQGSDQLISWSVPSNITLKSIKIELYQNNILRKGLGSSNHDVRNFHWKVSYNAPLGSAYLIKVTGVSMQGKTAWSNTPYFSIVSRSSTSISLFAIVGIILVSSICIFSYGRRSRVKRDSTPHALPVCQVGPNNPTAIPVYIEPTSRPYIYPQSRRNGYSSSAVAGAGLAGMLGGALLENASESHSHRHFQSRTNNDDFGDGLFGNSNDGGGGASSGDFC